jgi:hypothetical protein
MLAFHNQEWTQQPTCICVYPQLLLLQVPHDLNLMSQSEYECTYKVLLHEEEDQSLLQEDDHDMNAGQCIEKLSPGVDLNLPAHSGVELFAAVSECAQLLLSHLVRCQPMCHLRILSQLVPQCRVKSPPSFASQSHSTLAALDLQLSQS